MKLKELNDNIASTCKVRPNVVTSVQSETFKLLRAALEKGEKVIIPGFGQFVVRDVPAEGEKAAKKVIRFKLKSGEGNAKPGKEKGARKNKEETKTDTAPGEGDDE